MRKIIVAGALCVGLAGCSGFSLSQVAATATRAALPAGTVEKITGLCRSGEPLISLAAAAPWPADVKTITSYLAGYCDQMASDGQLPPTTDQNTVSWLTQNLSTLRALLGR